MSIFLKNMSRIEPGGSFFPKFTEGPQWGYQFSPGASPVITDIRFGARENPSRVDIRMKELLEQGDYEGICDYKAVLEEQMRGKPLVEREVLMGNAVKQWVIEAYGMTQLSDELSRPHPDLRETDLIAHGRVDRSEFEQIFDLFAKMRDFKNGANPHVVFRDIEKSPLFSAPYGIFRLRHSQSDTKYQQSRLVLLSMVGLGYEKMDELFSFVGWERASRSMTGKLPTGESVAI